VVSSEMAFLRRHDAVGLSSVRSSRMRMCDEGNTNRFAADECVVLFLFLISKLLLTCRAVGKEELKFFK
jgi:hypothetical protein